MRSPRSGFGSRPLRAAVGSLALLLATLVWSGAAVAEPSPASRATITGSFSDGCRDFTSRATKLGSQEGKDISYVELHYADGRVVKDEIINSPDYALDGAAGDEIDFAIVKSGTTTEPFDCVLDNRPPTALLEIKTPPIDQIIGHCWEFDGTTCDQFASRTVWSSISELTNDHGSWITWGCGGFSDPSLCSYAFDFRGTSSSDPDNDITSWSLDFGDGTSASGSWTADPPADIAHVYDGASPPPDGSCGPVAYFVCVTLTVSDAAGQSDSDTIPMGFIDQSPD
jgi:hypothetical protein